MKIRSKATWLCIITTMILASTIWFITDEPLDYQPSAALNINTLPISRNNGFICLLGLDANENTSAYELGKTRLLQHRVWLKNPTISTPPSLPNKPTYRAPLWFDGSDEELLTHAQDIRYIIALNNTLYSHYHNFLKLSEFNALMHLSDEQIEVIEEYLQLGNRFLRADVLAHALTGSTSAASALLIDDINNWRRQLTLADTFSHKLLAARILEKNFSLIVTLAKKNILEKEALLQLGNALDAFSMNELSLERPLLHTEFSKMGYVLLEAAKNPTIVEAHQNNSYTFKLLYKPNMSVNFLYDQYMIIAQENNLPPRQLMINLQQGQQRQLTPTLTQWIKNRVGIATVQTLLSVDFQSYTARLWDVDVNRLLTRLIVEAQLARVNSRSTLDAFIQQPRFRGIWDNNPPHYTSNGNALCYNTSMKDQNGLRCVSTNWLLHKTP